MPTIVGIDAGDSAVLALPPVISDTEWVVNRLAEYREENVYRVLQQRGDLTRIVSATQNPALAQVTVDTRYITGSGHGDPNTFEGHDNSPIFAVGNYDHQLVEGKLVHLVSCYTAKELGADFVRKGCQAFFGYDGDFFFLFEDPNPFLKCDSQVDFALADGNDAGTAYQTALAAYNEAIDANKAIANNPATATADAKKKRFEAAVLKYDRDHLCGPGKLDSNGTYGDTTAMLP